MTVTYCPCWRSLTPVASRLQDILLYQLDQIHFLKCTLSFEGLHYTFIKTRLLNLVHEKSNYISNQTKLLGMWNRTWYDTKKRSPWICLHTEGASPSQPDRLHPLPSSLLHLLNPLLMSPCPERKTGLRACRGCSPPTRKSQGHIEQAAISFYVFKKIK